MQKRDELIRGIHASLSPINILAMYVTNHFTMPLHVATEWQMNGKKIDI